MLQFSQLKPKGRPLLSRLLLFVMLMVLAPLPVSAQEQIRGMYINAFTRFIGHARAEQELINFVKDNKITYAAMYITPTQLPQYGAAVSDLINRLKSEGGLLEVGATTGASDAVVKHNEQYSGKFDVMNLENEFWGPRTGTPEREERFQSFINQLDVMTGLAEGTDLKVEAYIGWPTQAEMAQIVTRLDRLLIHTYVPTPDRTYATINTRLQWIANVNSDVEVMPIYSLEKTENNREDGPVFMGQWTIDNSPNRSEYDFTHAFDLAESTFEAGFNAANINVNMVGHQYFTYTNLVKMPPDNFIDTPSTPHIVVEDGATTPMEFTVRGLHDAQLGVEWYQSGVGHIGSPRFNGQITNTKVITAKPPYSIAAVAFDSGSFGRQGLYAKQAVGWFVHAGNTLPKGTPTLPQSLDVYLDVGDTQTFIHTATDAEGNLSAADWYAGGYLGRSNITGKSATTSRDITFDTAGTFRVFVDLFDRAMYMPDGAIRTSKVAQSVSWTVHVGTGTKPAEYTTPDKLRGRYLMIRKAGTGTLSIAGVEVRPTTPNGGINTRQNIALNKDASQSSTDFGGVASRAVDGNNNGIFTGGSVTHTDVDSANPWWRVDFGATYDVSRINIFNRTDCCSQRLDGAVVYIGNTPSSNPADYTVVGVLNGGTAAQQFTGATALAVFTNANSASTQVIELGAAIGVDASSATNLNADRDLDGVPAYIDDNDYNDQVGDDNNAVESYFDPDGDGTVSVLTDTLDTDADLVPDQIEVINGTDPTDALSFTDFDNDLLPDYVDSDDDNDGIPDFIEGDADIDNDGIPNRFDLDSDGDGTEDAIEGIADVDGNSIPNFVDNTTTSAVPTIDQDKDGISDEIERKETDQDPDLDGIPNFLDDDSDGDLIPDLDETNGDFDADGIPNYLDADSDGDLISDLIEGNVDTDLDGMPDFLDTIVDPITEAGVDTETGGDTGIVVGGGAFDSVLSLFVAIACLVSRRRRSSVSRK